MKDANVTPSRSCCVVNVKLNVQDILYNLYNKYMVYFYVNACCLAWFSIFFFIFFFPNRREPEAVEAAFPVFPAAAPRHKRRADGAGSVRKTQGGARPLAQRFEEQEDDTAKPSIIDVKTEKPASPKKLRFPRSVKRSQNNCFFNDLVG